MDNWEANPIRTLKEYKSCSQTNFPEADFWTVDVSRQGEDLLRKHIISVGPVIHQPSDLEH